MFSVIDNDVIGLKKGLTNGVVRVLHNSWKNNGFFWIYKYKFLTPAIIKSFRKYLTNKSLISLFFLNDFLFLKNLRKSPTANEV